MAPSLSGNVAKFPSHSYLTPGRGLLASDNIEYYKGIPTFEKKIAAN
jgi:hypothetical protein